MAPLDHKKIEAIRSCREQNGAAIGKTEARDDRRRSLRSLFDTLPA